MANLGLDEAVKPRCVTLYGIPFWRLEAPGGGIVEGSPWLRTYANARA